MGASRNEQLGQRLLQLKKEIEDKRDARAQLQGELKSLYKQMVDEFGIETIEEAKEKLEQLEDELSNMEDEIQKGLEKIERMMGE